MPVGEVTIMSLKNSPWAGDAMRNIAKRINSNLFMINSVNYLP
jgi:hypothetical protein